MLYHFFKLVFGLLLKNFFPHIHEVYLKKTPFFKDPFKGRNENVVLTIEIYVIL